MEKWNEVLDKLTPLHKELFDAILDAAIWDDLGKFILSDNGTKEFRESHGLSKEDMRRLFEGFVDCSLLIKIREIENNENRYFVSPDIRFEGTREELLQWRNYLGGKGIDYVPSYPGDNNVNISYIRNKFEKQKV